MARLYRYADSNEKSGYYIIGNNGNATFQVEPIARCLFDKLEYHPPIRTEDKGPQIPSKLHWLLFDIGWIFTGEKDAGNHKTEEIPNQLETTDSLTDEMVGKIRQFVKEQGGEERLKLANQFDFDVVYEEQEQLATLDEKQYEPLEEYVWGYMHSAFTKTEEESIKSMDVTVLDLSGDQNPRSSLNIIVEATETEPNFRHTITSSIEDEISVVSATDAPQTWGERGRMDRHRGYLFSALEAISEDMNMDFEFDETEISGDVRYFTSFEEGIVLPDKMRPV